MLTNLCGCCAVLIQFSYRFDHVNHEETVTIPHSSVRGKAMVFAVVMCEWRKEWLCTKKDH